MLLCFGVWQCMIMSEKQREIKFKPRIKVNYNIHIELAKKSPYLLFAVKTVQTRASFPG